MTESHQRWFHNLFQLQKLLGWQIIDKALSLELGPGKRGFMSVVMSYGVMVLGCAQQTPCSCVQCKYQRDIKYIAKQVHEITKIFDWLILLF